MSMRELLAGGGGVKSIQTGYVLSPQLTSAGSGEDARSFDVTISAVNTAKSIVIFDGVASNSAGERYNAGSNLSYLPTARLTSATNLRFGNSANATTYICGRWTVVEYK